MPLVSGAIPNLINGVSQQPPSLRLPTQGAIQENGLSSVVRGLEKRPGTQHISEIDTSFTDSTAFIHTIQRDEEEAYVSVLSDKSIKVFDLVGKYVPKDGSSAQGGNQVPVYADDTFTPLSNTQLNYLDVPTDSTAQATFGATTVADFTFLLNRSKTITKGSTYSHQRPYEAYVYIKNGDYKSKYSITVSMEVNNVEYKFTSTAETPDGLIKSTSSGEGTSSDPQITNQLNNQGTVSTKRIASSLAYGSSGLSAGTDVITNISIVNALGTAITNAGTLSTNINDATKWKKPNGTAAAETDIGSGSGSPGDYVSSFGVKYNADDNFIYIYSSGTNKINFDVEVSDSRGNEDIDVFVGHDQVSSFGKLPATLPGDAKKGWSGSAFTNDGTGFTIKVGGDNQKAQDDYYVFWNGKTWKETLLPRYAGETTDPYKTSFDASTMPHQLKKAFTNVTGSLTNVVKTNATHCTVTIANHKFVNGDKVTISGTTNFNGSALTISEVTTNTFKVDKAITTSPSAETSGTVTTDSSNRVYFILEDSPWVTRTIGDIDTNPFPSFTDFEINDIFFHRNRLGFLSDENVIFSEAGGFYNLFVTTTLTILDSEPIDVAVSNNQVSILRHAIPFNESLLIFSDLQQFKVSAGELLTPTTVSIDVATNFETDTTAKPVPAGRYVYFPFKRGDFSGVREYFLDISTETSDAQEVTAHVPEYIEGNILQLASSSNEEILLALGDTDRKSIYVYKYFWSGAEKLQSSWSKWTFDADVLSMSILGSDVFLLFKRSNSLFLEKLTLSSDPASEVMVDKQSIHLDRRVELKTGGTTTLPYTATNAEYILDTGKIIALSDVSAQLTAGKSVFAGIPFTFKYRVSEQVHKENEVTVEIARLQIRNMSFNFSNSGFFEVIVSPLPTTGRTSRTNTFSGLTVGTAVIDKQSLQSGTFRVPVLSKSDNVTIEIQNAKHLPCRFQSAEYEGFLVVRSPRS